MQVAVTETMYAIPCTETIERGYVFNGKRFYSMSWLREAPKELTDQQKVAHVNNQLVGKQCKRCVTGRVKKGLVEIYLEDVILVPENGVHIQPKHLFIQRLVPQTRTFDLVVIDDEYQPHVISAIPKRDVDVIQAWHGEDIFCGGADPLPVKALAKELQRGVTYEEICDQLGGDSDSDSDWVP